MTTQTVQFEFFLRTHGFANIGEHIHHNVLISGADYQRADKDYKVYVKDGSQYCYTARRTGDNDWRVICFNKKTLLPLGQVEVTSENNFLTTNGGAIITALDPSENDVEASNPYPWRKVKEFHMLNGANGSLIQKVPVEKMTELLKQHFELIKDWFVENKRAINSDRKAVLAAYKEIEVRQLG